MKGDIYHILNRGVEKRDIFLDDFDRARFVNNLNDFNDEKPVALPYNDRRRIPQKNLALREPGKELVDVLCWCLMKNHYHLLVREKVDRGASIFSQKISSGHTQYFNLKNDRSGVLFQGRSKKVLIREDKHFWYIPFYIFSNPIKQIDKNWKEKGIRDIKKTLNFLENYKWSNYPEIVSARENCWVGDKGLFFEVFDTNKKIFAKDFKTWLCESQEI